MTKSTSPQWGTREIPHHGGTRTLSMRIVNGIQCGVCEADDKGDFGWWLAGYPTMNERGREPTLRDAQLAAERAARSYGTNW